MVRDVYDERCYLSKNVLDMERIKYYCHYATNHSLQDLGDTKGRMKYENFLTILIIIGIGLFSFVVLYQPMIEISNNNFCESKGYDYSTTMLSVKEGYIACCKILYKDNIEDRRVCEAVEK